MAQQKIKTKNQKEFEYQKDENLIEDGTENVAGL